MMAIKGMKQVRTSLNIGGFRACLHKTGVSSLGHERQRVAHEKRLLMGRQGHHLWLVRQWGTHFECAAGSLRVLPPSARAAVEVFGCIIPWDRSLRTGKQAH